MNPFLNALEALGTVAVEHVRDAAGAVSQHVNTGELVKAAVHGAIEGLPGGPAGVGIGALESVIADLPNIATPQDQKMFAAGLTLAQEIYAILHPTPAATPAP